MLTAADFGVEMESDAQIQERRDRIDTEVAGKVGWCGDGGPKDFFDSIKREMEFVTNGGDANIMESNWNIVVTGNPGTGTTGPPPLTAILTFISRQR